MVFGAPRRDTNRMNRSALAGFTILSPDEGEEEG